MKLVSSFSRPALELWLNQHVEYGKKLAELVIRQAQARTRAGQKVEKRKSSGVAVLPGKLTDCESRDLTLNELFLVEGDSAGGSAEGGRMREFQAILPLRGKIINAYKSREDKVLANEEVRSMISAVGSGIGEDQDLEFCRQLLNRSTKIVDLFSAVLWSASKDYMRFSVRLGRDTFHDASSGIRF